MGADSYHCPGCGRALPPGLTNCPDCGLQLVGPGAEQLWQLDQQLRALQTEREHLVATLRRPLGAVPTAPSLPPVTSPSRTSGRQRTTGPSGQQLVLGLGALLLLAAVSFFIAVVWILVGVIGQSVILVGLIATALVAARLAVRRSLSIAAETAAVIAIGLLLLSVAAAYSKGLFGLDQIDAPAYAAGAGVVIGLLLVGFDRLVPREPGGRRILCFLPAANVAWALAPWLALVEFDPHRLRLAAALFVVLAVAAAHMLVAMRLVPLRRWCWGPAAVSTAVAALGYEATVLVEAYRLPAATSHRYLAAAMLLVLPTLLFVVVRRMHLSEQTLPVLALAVVPAIVVPALDLGAWPLAAITVLIGVLLAATARGHGVSAHVRLVTSIALPVLVAAAAGLRLSGATSWRQAVLQPGDNGMGALAPVIVGAAIWATACLVVLAVRRNTAWVILAQISAAATIAVCLWDAPEATRVFVTLAWFLVETVLAVLAARGRLPHAHPVEVTALLAGAASAIAMLVSGLIAWESARAEALLLYAVGLSVLAVATSPRRLGFSYLGSLLVSGGTWCLLGDAHVTVLEAYTVPLAVLLALIGLMQWRLRDSVPSMMTMGPALSVLLLPSTFVAIGGGDPVRTTYVLVVDVALLLLGYQQKVKAPVLFATVSLVLIGLTRGGALITHVNGWVVLLAAAGVLLTIGVRWEQATLTGRRAAHWFTALQ